MKVILLLSALAAMVAIATARFEFGTLPPYINRPKPPQDWPRYRREANPNPQDGFRPNNNGLDYGHTIIKGENGQLSGFGGFQVAPGHGVLTHGGLSGSLTDGPGTFGGFVDKPFNGPETRPTYGLGYSHQIYNGRDGSLSLGVKAQKPPGQDWQPFVGVQGTFGR